jgi:hypothetical protein
MKNDYQIAIRIPTSLWNSIVRIANKQKKIMMGDEGRVSANSMIREFIREGVKRYEDKENK